MICFNYFILSNYHINFLLSFSSLYLKDWRYFEDIYVYNAISKTFILYNLDWH